MKKQYSKPELQVIELNHADIIATSSSMGVRNDPYNEDIYGE